MADNCQYCGGRLKKLHPAHEALCMKRPSNNTVTPVTPVTPAIWTTAVTRPVTRFTCDACDIKDSLIADLRQQVDQLLGMKKLVVAGLEAEAQGAPVKKSRAEYMAKRRAAKKASP